MTRVWRVFSLTLAALLLAMMPGIAGSSQPCAPFRDGKVDPAKLDSMLDAADDGRLYRIETDNSEFGFSVTSSLQEVRGKFLQVQGGMAVDTLGIEQDHRHPFNAQFAGFQHRHDGGRVFVIIATSAGRHIGARRANRGLRRAPPNRSGRAGSAKERESRRLSA